MKSKTRYLSWVIVTASLIIMIAILMFTKVSWDSKIDDVKPASMVLYPKNDMMVNEISENTIVITTLDFEDAFTEIEKVHNEMILEEENE